MVEIAAVAALPRNDSEANVRHRKFPVSVCLLRPAHGFKMFISWLSSLKPFWNPSKDLLKAISPFRSRRKGFLSYFNRSAKSSGAMRAPRRIARSVPGLTVLEP